MESVYENLKNHFRRKLSCFRLELLGFDLLKGVAVVLFTFLLFLFLNIDVNILEIGVYTAKYILTDVWGRTIEKTRKVTVVEENPLEHNRIILKDSSNNEELMEFYIDTISYNYKHIPIRCIC